MYTKILAQGTKFGSGTTGLDNPDVRCSVMYTLTKLNERNNFYFSIDNTVFKYYQYYHLSVLMQKSKLFKKWVRYFVTLLFL